MTRPLVIVFWCIITALAVLWIVTGVQQFSAPVAHQRATTAWPSTTGTIDGGVDIRESTRDGRNPDGSARYRQDLTVWYSYTVNGQAYRNHRYTYLVGQFDTVADAEMAAASLTIGSNLPVHYDPANPSESVLVAGEAPITTRHTRPIATRLYIIPGVVLIGWVVIGVTWWRGRGA